MEMPGKQGGRGQARLMTDSIGFRLYAKVRIEVEKYQSQTFRTKLQARGRRLERRGQ